MGLAYTSMDKKVFWISSDMLWFNPKTWYIVFSALTNLQPFLQWNTLGDAKLRSKVRALHFRYLLCLASNSSLQT